MLVDAMSVLPATPVATGGWGQLPPKAGCAGPHRVAPNSSGLARPADPVVGYRPYIVLYLIIDIISYFFCILLRLYV